MILLWCRLFFSLPSPPCVLKCISFIAIRGTGEHFIDYPAEFIGGFSERLLLFRIFGFKIFSLITFRIGLLFLYPFVCFMNAPIISQKELLLNFVDQSFKLRKLLLQVAHLRQQSPEILAHPPFELGPVLAMKALNLRLCPIQIVQHFLVIPLRFFANGRAVDWHHTPCTRMRRSSRATPYGRLTIRVSHRPETRLLFPFRQSFFPHLPVHSLA